MASDNIQNNQNIGNKELLDFLIKRFDIIDQRFDANDKRFDIIDQRFDIIDQRFVANDKRFDAIQNQHIADFKTLVEFLAGEFDKIHQTKADKADTATKEDINLVLNRVATINTKIDDYRAEQIGLKRQVDKHEKWHFAVAKKVGVSLLPE